MDLAPYQLATTCEIEAAHENGEDKGFNACHGMNG